MSLLERRARRKRLKIAILRAMRKGFNGSEAAAHHGVSLGTFFQWQWSDAAFSAALKVASKERVRYLKLVVVAKLRDGWLLK